MLGAGLVLVWLLPIMGRRKKKEYHACHYCTKHTVYNRGQKKYPACTDGIPPPFTLRCKQCKKKFCSYCMEKLYCKATTKSKNHPFFKKVKQHLDNPPTENYAYINGACCMIKKWREKVKKAAKLQKEFQDSPWHLIKDLPPGTEEISGILWIPEAGIAIPSTPHDCTDNMAIGNEGIHVPALWHAVAGEDCVAHHARNGIYPETFDGKPHTVWVTNYDPFGRPLPKDKQVSYFLGRRASCYFCFVILFHFLTLNFGSFYCLLQLLVDVYKIDELLPFDEDKLKATNWIPKEMVESCKLFEPRDCVDVSVVLGPIVNGIRQLILCRCHNCKYIPPEGDEIDEFLHELKELAGKDKGGFCVNRRAGSNGKWRYDKPLMDFLNSNKAFPRKSDSVVIIPQDDGMECYYMSPKSDDGQKEAWNEIHPECPMADHHPYYPAYFPYAPPVKGGSFMVTTELVADYPFLLEFQEKKTLTAHICRELSQREFDYDISPAACQGEIRTQEIILGHLAMKELLTQKDRKTRHWSDIDHFLFGCMTKNRFTLVVHPVYFHPDIFHKGKESIENKKCFVSPTSHHSIGRGGGGHNYTFALLDWQ